MSRLPLLFLAAAAACLVAGICLGIGMGITHNFQWAPVHAHLNLLGWTSLSLMGLTYRAYPQLAEARVAALAQFALSAGAAVAFPAGIYVAIEHHSTGLAIGAALTFLAGAVLFLVRLVRLGLRPAPSRLAMMAAD